MSLVALNMPYFPDPSIGRPVAFGSIYVGEPDLDPEIVANQKTISIRQEDGTEIPVSQPVLTGAGGVPMYAGSPVQILVDGDYSLKVLNQSGTQVYYIDSAVNLNPSSVLNIFGAYDTIADLRNAAIYTNANAYVKGYSTVGDGGHGNFLWVSSPLAAEVTADTQFGIYVAPTSDLTGASGAWVRQYSGAVNVKWFGVSEASSDNKEALQAALNQAINRTLFLPEGTYIVGSEINVPSNTIIRGEGTLSTGAGGGTHNILGGSPSYVDINGISFVGPGFTPGDSAFGFGIAFTGGDNGAGSAPTYIKNISISDCYFENWTAGGVSLYYVDDFFIRGCESFNTNKYGLLISSCSNGVIEDNTFTDITTPSGSSYGVIVTSTWSASKDTIRYPRSKHIVLADNYVDNVVAWTGLDTHGGLDIVFRNNTILNTPFGINLGKVDSGGADNMFSSEHCIAEGNYIVGNVTNFGVANSGSADLKGVGNKIVNNTLISCGKEDDANAGAIYVNYQRDSVVSGNQLHECATSAITYVSGNENIICTDNLVVDPYTDTFSASRAIKISTAVTGVIGDNIAVKRNTGVGTHVTTRGLEVADAAGLVLKDNDFEQADSPYIISSGVPVSWPQQESGVVSATMDVGTSIYDFVVPLQRTWGTSPIIITLGTNRASTGSVALVVSELSKSLSSVTLRYQTADGSNFPAAYNVNVYYRFEGY